MHAGRVKSHACPHAFWKASNTDKQQQSQTTSLFTRSEIIIFFCFCRLCTRARRRAGRSTARHRTQMGSASAPWSHQPRTCVTATHAAGSSASSWRRWQLSIIHFETRLLPTQAQALKHKLPQSTILVSGTVCRTQPTFYFLYPTVGQQLKQWEDCWSANELAFSLLTRSVELFIWTKILISLNAAR